CREAGGLRLTFLRFDEVRESVHAPERREVHERAPRNGREEPAGEMLGLRDLYWSDAERPAERRAGGCPTDAQEKRPSEVSQEVAAEDRGAEWVAACEPVNERSE